jgi:hypothetical protein
MRTLAGALLLTVASFASLLVGRRLELVIPLGDDACGAVCCCAPASPTCCSSACEREALPAVRSTCGCSHSGELHLLLVTGEWIPATQARGLEQAPPSPAVAALAAMPDSRSLEPETPPPRGDLDRDL